MRHNSFKLIQLFFFLMYNAHNKSAQSYYDWTQKYSTDSIQIWRLFLLFIVQKQNDLFNVFSIKTTIALL